MVETAVIQADTGGCPQLLPDSTGQSTVAADSVVKKESFKKRFLDQLKTLYFTSKHDSNYVVRPKSNKGLTLKLFMNETGYTFHAKGTVNNIYTKTDLSTNRKTTFSLAANFMGIGAAVAINPAQWSGAYKDYEFNLSYNGSRFSLDLSYQQSESLSGDVNSDIGGGHLEEGDATMKVLNLTGYYTFNHRRFSYPAAFSQSYIQRRSAGSWLVGISYQGGSIKTTEELERRLPEAEEIELHFGHLGIGGGYGYNWVPGRRWLLHLSILPTVVVFNRNRMVIDGEEKKAERMRINMIFNERLAVVYQFSHRFFAGATLVMNNSIFDDKSIVVNQNKWRARAFIGMRI